MNEPTLNRRSALLGTIGALAGATLGVDPAIGNDFSSMEASPIRFNAEGIREVEKGFLIDRIELLFNVIGNRYGKVWIAGGDWERIWDEEERGFYFKGRIRIRELTDEQLEARLAAEAKGHNGVISNDEFGELRAAMVIYDLDEAGLTVPPFTATVVELRDS